MSLDICEHIVDQSLPCSRILDLSLCIVGNGLMQGVALGPAALQQTSIPKGIQRLGRLLTDCQSSHLRETVWLRRKDGEGTQSGLDLWAELPGTNSDSSVQGKGDVSWKAGGSFVRCGWYAHA